MAAREHPAAVVKRQQERDVAALLPSISHLTERQYQLFFLFQGVIARHAPDGFSRLVDLDVAQAAGAMAATLETAVRGVLYEHTPASMPAQRLAREIAMTVEEIRTQGAKVYDGEAAIALRAVERGAQDAHTKGADENAYIALMGRLLRVRTDPRQRGDTDPSGSLIVP